MNYGEYVKKRYLLKSHRQAIVVFILFSFSAPSLFSHVDFFMTLNPALTWTNNELLQSIDEKLLTPEDYTRYYTFPSLSNFGLEMRQKGVGLVFRVDIRPDFLSFMTEPYLSNLPWVERPLISAIGDVNMPTVGYLDFQGNNLTLSAGRRQLKWGPAQFGLAISDAAPYLDHIWLTYQFDMPHGRWWYNFVAISSDRAGQSWSNLDTSGIGYKSIFAHRAGYENDWCRIAIGELNLVHDSVPNLVDMSPIAAFHNLYEDIYSNVMLDATAEFATGRLRAYGEFVMDDLVMNWESWQGRPTALGWNFGLEVDLMEGKPYQTQKKWEHDYLLAERTFRRPGGLSLIVEHYRTTTYLYNRENISGKWTLTDHRLVNSSSGYIDSGEAFFLGFTFGPDVALDLLNLTWESEKFKTGMMVAWLRQGALTIQSPYPPTDGAGTWFKLQEPILQQIRFGFWGEYSLSSAMQIWSRNEFKVGDNPDMSFSAGVTFNFRIGNAEMKP